MLHSSRPDEGADPQTQRRDCRKRAMDLLARREHGCAELRRKLVQKGFDTELALDVVTELEADGLVADTRFAEAFVRSRIGRGHGPRRIQAELQERGIDEARIHAAVHDADCDWVAQAAAARRKRFGSPLPTDLKDRGRQSRFLNYRGFTGEQIKRALELADNTD